MKQFLLKAGLFLILPIVGGIIFFNGDYSRAFAYEYVEGDCSARGKWIYSRVYQDSTPIEVLLIGSSHTFNGVDDEYLDSIWGVNVANLAYCRFGRNLSYVVLKDVFLEKKPKKVILEIGFDEIRDGHPIYGFLADKEELFYPSFIGNRHFIGDMKKGYFRRLQQLKKGSGIDEVKIDQAFGFGTFPDSVNIERLLDAQKKAAKYIGRKESEKGRDIYFSYTRSYLKKIHQLCVENDAQLEFLYLPSYAYALAGPKQLELYESYGKVYFPPDSIFTNINNWYDEHHLNQAGATKLSNWLGSLKE